MKSGYRKADRPQPSPDCAYAETTLCEVRQMLPGAKVKRPGYGCNRSLMGTLGTSRAKGSGLGPLTLWRTYSKT